MSQQQPTFRDLLHPYHFLALGAGSGLAPKAPGTFGTLAAIPLVWCLAKLPLGYYAGGVLLAAVAGVFLCGWSARKMGVHDHPAIVWDEIVGFAIAMFAIPATWHNLLIAFVLFRLFDIWKPGPIGWFDKKFHGGLGIMLDDILAGLATLGCMASLQWAL